MLSKDIILNSWFKKKRQIRWTLRFGLNKYCTPALTGSFAVTPDYLDDQGDKWGDTYIRDIGKYFDEYSFWFERQFMHPVGGNGNATNFQVDGFSTRQFKSAAHGVTGMIGEVLIVTLLQNVFSIKPNEFAFLRPDNNTKTPDIVLDVESSFFSALIRSFSDIRNSSLHDKNLIRALTIESYTWASPLPIECKSTRINNGGDMRHGLQQLLSYWSTVYDMAGTGLFVQVNVVPTTRIDLFLIIPKSLKHQDEIYKIASRNVYSTHLPDLGDEPLLLEIKNALEGRILG